MPDYLRNQLCDGLLTKANRRSGAGAVPAVDRLPAGSGKKGSIEAEVIPPRPAHLIKEDAVGNSIEIDPLFGIPIQRSVQHQVEPQRVETSGYAQTNIYKPQVKLHKITMAFDLNNFTELMA